MSLPPNRTKKFSKGFTMIEVMTATVIMVIIVTFALKIAVDTTVIYDNGMSALKTASDSRSVLSAITQDFESAIIRNDGRYWMEIDHEEAVGNIPEGNSPSIMLYASDPGRIKRSPDAPEGIPGSICAIKYKIGHRSPFDNPGDYVQQIYALYRASIDAQGTFGVLGKTSPLAQTLEEGKKLSDIWRGSADVLDKNRQRAPMNLTNWVQEIQNFKTAGVVSLSLVFYYQETDSDKRIKALAHADIVASVTEAHANAKLTEISEVKPYQKNVKFKYGKIFIDTDDDAGAISGVLRSIEVAVTVLSPDGDRTLRALQKTGGAPKVNQDRFNKILREQGYTYNTTIPVFQ